MKEEIKVNNYLIKDDFFPGFIWEVEITGLRILKGENNFIFVKNDNK